MSGHAAESDGRTSGHAWVNGRCANCDAATGRPWAETCLGSPERDAARERFVELRMQDVSAEEAYERATATANPPLPRLEKALGALADRLDRLSLIAGTGRVGTTAAIAYAQAADELRHVITSADGEAAS